jgi:hypothetical protein
LVFFSFTFFVTSSLWAAKYYVAQKAAGGNTGVDCANAKSLLWFNSNAIGGDTATLCDGKFTTLISPSNSGTSENPITYIADTKHAAIISKQSYGANLTDKNYIVIDGLYFNHCGAYWIKLSNSKYNTIKNCKFYKARAWSGIHFSRESDYNKIFDNIFEDAPLSGDANVTWPADMICTDSKSNSFNLIQGNTFGRSAHASIGAYNTYRWVYRSNKFQNTFHTALGPGGSALVERNYFYDVGEDFKSNPGLRKTFYVRIRHPAIQLNYSRNIIRKNIFDNVGSGIFIASLENYDADDNRIYNNTVNKAVRNIWGEYTGTKWNLDNNVWKNNSITETFDTIAEDGKTRGTAYAVYYRPGYRGGGSGNKWYSNNFFSINDEKYKIRSTIDTLSNIQKTFASDFPGATNVQIYPKYTDSENRVFTLQPDSPLIDGGTWLTTVTSSTESSVHSFKVADSRYFYDGWKIPGETGDIIKTQNGSVATIDKIDYDTNTITVKAAIDIVKNEGVALDYNGSTPDIGAFEFDGVNKSTLDPPKKLHINLKE